jgi:hypothetical protein
VAFLRDRRFVGLLIAIGVILIVALTVVGFSGAYFTSSSRSPGNEFAAGGVSFTLSVTGPVVDGSEMAPGDSRDGEQIVTNTGHPAKLVLDVLNLDTGSPLTDVLDVRVRQTSPSLPDSAYDGPLAGLDRVNLGTFAKDESRTYTITVTWPTRDDNIGLRGEQTSLDFDWQMVSVS